jgi:hypothetical protein
MTKSRKKSRRPVDVHQWPTTAAPITVSGAYLHLARAGEHEEFARLQMTFWTLRAQLQDIDQELTNRNNPIWLAKLVVSARRAGKKFDTVLRLRVAQLERRKSTTAAKLEHGRRKIEKLEKSLPIGNSTTLATPMQPTMFSSAPRISGSGPNANAAVQVRDQTIRKYKTLPNQQICLKLDAELIQSGASPIRFPVSWQEDFAATSFISAYDDPRVRNRVQKLIWKAKQSF